MSRLETPPPQAPLSVPERLSVLAERSRSLAEAPPQPSTVEALRLAIGDLSDEARDGLHDSYSRALARLGALMEVGECLSAESREAAGDLWVFCGEALVLLSQLARSAAPPEEVVDRIIQQSSSSWGDYLAVLEPSDESPDAYPVDLTEEPLPDDIPAFDSQALLRLLAGSGEIDAEKAESSAPEPDSLRWGVGGDGHADSGREIDAEAEATRLDDLPPSHGAAPLAIPALPQRIELDDELREAFLADAMELSERIADLVLTLSRGADLGELRRGLHTLKGAAGCVGLVDLALLVHAVEERLDGSPVAPEVEESLHGMLGYLDGILGLLRRPKRRTAVGPAAEVRPVAAEGSFASASAPVPVDQAPPAQGDDGEATDDGPIRVPSSRLDDLMDLVSELVVRRRLWSAQAEGLKTVAAMVRSCRAGMLRSIDLLHRAGLGRGRGRSGPGPHVDVPGQLRRLEELADDLAVLAESSRAASVPLADHGDALARLSIQLWDELQVLRVVTVRALFQRLTRVAHEAARVEGRKVEVLTLGEETGVDRAVSEKAFEPLLHVVRNAVGHGIESPEERAHAGKPAAGRVTLEASARRGTR
ncbi:MAG: Hpt domain-containing protein [Isosphaeraceae bacterium]